MFKKIYEFFSDEFVRDVLFFITVMLLLFAMCAAPVFCGYSI